MGWKILVLIQKGTTTTIGIVLLETLWEVVEAMIDTRLRFSLHMHDVLHVFRSRRGTGTAITELKLSQELASMYQDPLFLVFLDLRKAYNTVDRDRLFSTLEAYGAVPHMCGLLETFWDFHQVVPRQNGFRKPAFPVTRGTMQCVIVYLTLFNVVVHNAIITWLYMTVEDQKVAQDRLGETIRRCVLFFYADDGMIGSRNSD